MNNLESKLRNDLLQRGTIYRLVGNSLYQFNLPPLALFYDNISLGSFQVNIESGRDHQHCSCIVAVGNKANIGFYDKEPHLSIPGITILNLFPFIQDKLDGIERNTLNFALATLYAAPNGLIFASHFLNTEHIK